MDSTQYVLNTLRKDITEHNLQIKAIIQVNIKNPHNFRSIINHTRTQHLGY